MLLSAVQGSRSLYRSKLQILRKTLDKVLLSFCLIDNLACATSIRAFVYLYSHARHDYQHIHIAKLIQDEITNS